MNKKYDQSYDIVCFTSDKTLGKVISESAESLGKYTHQVMTGSLAEAIDYIKLAKAPKVVCIDCGNIDLLISKVEAFVEFCPLETQIIIIGDKNDVGIFRDLLELDIVDYFFKPLSPDILCESLNKALKKKGRHPRSSTVQKTGKVISFIGTVGGVGTTTLATNTACFLANHLGKRVLLIDADLQFGNVATLLNLKPSNALLEAIENPDRVDDVFLENSMASFDERLRVLSAEGSLRNPLQMNTPQFVDNFHRLIQILSRFFHYVIVDFSRHHTFLWQPLRQKEGTVFLVCEPTVTSLRDTIRMTDIFNEGKEHLVTRIILNQVKRNPMMVQDKFEKYLEKPINIMIPFEPAAIEAADLGVPLIKFKAHFQREINKVTQLISGKNLHPTRLSLLKRWVQFFTKGSHQKRLLEQQDSRVKDFHTILTPPNEPVSSPQPKKFYRTVKEKPVADIKQFEIPNRQPSDAPKTEQ